MKEMYEPQNPIPAKDVISVIEDNLDRCTAECKITEAENIELYYEYTRLYNLLMKIRNRLHIVNSGYYVPAIAVAEIEDMLSNFDEEE